MVPTVQKSSLAGGLNALTVTEIRTLEVLVRSALSVTAKSLFCRAPFSTPRPGFGSPGHTDSWSVEIAIPVGFLVAYPMTVDSVTRIHIKPPRARIAVTIPAVWGGASTHATTVTLRSVGCPQSLAPHAASVRKSRDDSRDVCMVDVADIDVGVR